MNGTVGLLHYPMGEDMGVGRLRPRTPRRVLRRALAYRSNPRDPAYMEVLFRERHPEGTIVSPADPGWERKVLEAERVVVLFPDAIGLGFGGLERCLAATGVNAQTALNGRRREIPLDRASMRGLRARRLLERSMLVEATVLAVLALLTPALAIWDLVRGRR